MSLLSRFQAPFSILLLLFLALPAMAQIPGLKPAKKWQLDGYVHASLQGSFVDEAQDFYDQMLHQRFNYEYRFSDALRFNAGMRNRMYFGDSLDLDYFSQIIEHDTGYFDLSKNIVDEDKVLLNSQFDRLYLDWQDAAWQGRIGRFRVNWAMATIWNANDIFNTYSIYDVDYVERTGVDALLVKRHLGFASSGEAVFQVDEDSELHSYAGRYLFNQQGWDMQVIAGKAKLDRILGAGFAGAVLGAGIRGEFSWFSPIDDEWQGQELQTATVSTLELDYSFNTERNCYMRMAVLHISKAVEVDNPLVYLNQPLSPRTLSFTRFTGYADLGFDISPLNRMSLLTSYYEDGSYFFAANFNHSLSNNWDLAAILQRFDGSNASAFGQAASTFAYLQIKWGF